MHTLIIIRTCTVTQTKYGTHSFELAPRAIRGALTDPYIAMPQEEKTKLFPTNSRDSGRIRCEFPVYGQVPTVGSEGTSQAGDTGFHL